MPRLVPNKAKTDSVEPLTEQPTTPNPVPTETPATPASKALVAPISESDLDSTGSNLLKVALGKGNISIDIPETATLEQMMPSLSMSVKVYRSLDNAKSRMLPVIGRQLWHIAEHKLWKGHYKSFEKFISQCVVDQLGLSRTAAFEGKRIAAAFPTLAIEEYQQFGFVRLLEATKRIEREDTPVTERRSVLDSTLKKSTQELLAESKGATQVVKMAEDGSAVAHLSITTSELVKARWEALKESTHLDTSDLFTFCIDLWERKGPKGVHPTKRAEAKATAKAESSAPASAAA